MKELAFGSTLPVLRRLHRRPAGALTAVVQGRTKKQLPKLPDLH